MPLASAQTEDREQGPPSPAKSLPPVEQEDRPASEDLEAARRQGFPCTGPTLAANNNGTAADLHLSGELVALNRRAQGKLIRAAKRAARSELSVSRGEW